MAQSIQGSQSQGGQMASAGAGPSPGGSPSQIPDLLKIGQIPTNTQINVETAILEPVTQSATHCKFVLQNKGLLHSHSKIEFEFQSPTDGASPPLASPAMLPVGNGIHALIQRATMRVGTKTICEIEDYNFFAAYKSNFLSPEAELEREQYLTGRNGNVLDINYKDRRIGTSLNGVVVSNDFGSSEQSNTSADGLMLGNGREMDVASSGIAFPRGAAVASTMSTSTGAVRPLVDCTQLTRTEGVVTKQDLCPTFQIAISDLFPFLKSNQLPLYMMKEPVNFEFVFSVAGNSNTANSERVCSLTDDITAGVLLSSTRMIADHLYYPQDMMDAYANANRSLQFQYVDYRLSKFSVTKTGLDSTDIRNIGGAGRIISKIFWGINQTSTTVANGPNARWITNKYNAISPMRVYGDPLPSVNNRNGPAVFNLKVNEQFLFPIDVTNTARDFHNIVQTEGAVPFISREVYSKEGVSLTCARYGEQQMTGAVGGEEDQCFGSGSGVALAEGPIGPGADTGVGGQYPGTQFWNAMRLNRGERVNSRGIELYFKQEVDVLAASNMVQRVWLETLRTAVLQDGVMECFFA